MSYYNYDKNKDFIYGSNRLIWKLEAQKLWNKDTLVIGLDKSVRPLAYTMRKLSKGEGKDTPDFRFFNYSHYDLIDYDKDTKKYASYLKKKVNPKKLSKYKNIIVLDEYVYTGDTLKEANNILKEYFSKSKIKPKISLATLNTGSTAYSHLGGSPPEGLIYSEIDERGIKIPGNKTGVEDGLDSYKPFLKRRRYFTKSFRLKGQRNYQEFLQDRKKLSEDINKYLDEHNKYKDIPTGRKTLEKVTQTVSILSLIFGMFISYKSITGNAIGSSPFTNFSGIILILLAIIGFFLARKVRK
jgi:hypothetical protein